MSGVELLKKKQPGFLEKVTTPGTPENLLVGLIASVASRSFEDYLETRKSRRYLQERAQRLEEAREYRAALRDLADRMSPQELSERTARYWAVMDELRRES